MTNTQLRVTARERTPKFDAIWFTGKNALQVAEFLRDRSLRCAVEFHGYGEKLIIDGNTVSPVSTDGGIWVCARRDRALTVTKAAFAEKFEIVETR